MLFLNMKTLCEALKASNKFKILYIYAYGSSSNSSTYASLKKYLDKSIYSVYCFDYRQNNAKDALVDIKNIIKEKSIDLVVGSSLGGFITLMLRHIPKIVCNPACNPSSDIKSIGAPEKICKTYGDVQNKLWDNIDEFEIDNTYGLFGTNDELFKYKSEFDKHYKNSKYVCTKHKYTDNDVKEYLIPKINEIYSRLNEKMNNLSSYIITEHFVNCKSAEDMEKYKQQVWSILNKSYEYCGGMVGMDNVEQLIEETTLWKIITRDHKVSAVCVYGSKRGGRKICYLGSVNTEQGKNDLKSILKEDGKEINRHSWGEFSGKAATVAMKQGMMPIKANLAKLIMYDKKFIEVKPDGYFYTRNIGGNPHTKIMLGNYDNSDINIDNDFIEKIKELAKKYDEEDKSK